MIGDRLSDMIGAVYSDKVVVAVSDTAISIHKVPKVANGRRGLAKLLLKFRNSK